jgi:hypothetical protein
VFWFSIISFSKYDFEYPHLICASNSRGIYEYRMFICKIKFVHFPVPSFRGLETQKLFPFLKKLVLSVNEMSYADSGYIKIFVKNVHYCRNIVNIRALFIKNECIDQGIISRMNWTVNKQLIRYSFTRWIWIWYYFLVLAIKCENRDRNSVRIAVKYHEKNSFFAFLPYSIHKCYFHEKLIMQFDRAEAPLSDGIYHLLREFDFLLKL